MRRGMRGLGVGLAVAVMLVTSTGVQLIASATVPPGAVARYPALGRVTQVRAAPVTPAAKPIDGSGAGWDAGVRLTRLGGTTTIQAGELIYEDWLMDDSGATRQCTLQRNDTLIQPLSQAGFDKWNSDDSALGEELIPDADAVGLFNQPQTECQKGVERYGQMRYPAGATPGSADVQELRLAADPANVYVLVKINAMTATDHPVVALALDTDHNLKTGAGAWGLASGVTTPGADHIVTLTRTGLLLDGQPLAGARLASNDGGVAGPANPGGFGGFIEAAVPRSALGGSGVMRAWAGAGTWDVAAGRWAKPVGEAGPAVMNLAFRQSVEPLRAWMDQAQAFDLRRSWNGTTSTLGASYSAELNLADLAAGEDNSWQVSPGYYDRVFTSRVTDGGIRDSPPPANVETEGISAHQMYGLYVPTSYRAGRASPLTLWLHWRGPGDQQAAYYVPGMIKQLGEDRGNIIVSPRGRGSSGWYVGDSAIDSLDALDDGEGFLGADQDRVYVGGYSMGGWGAYMMATQFPDKFAAAFATVGPPAIGFWAYPAKPSMPQNGRPLYWTNPILRNARHVPMVIYHGTDDELVPVTGTIAQSKTLQHNRQPYKFFLFPGYEHFSFALADEWTKAANYLGNRRRAVNPAEVTYSRVPCMDPVQWSPVYGVVADSAYWVSGIKVRQAPSGTACTRKSSSLDTVNRSGTVDAISGALPRFADVGLPLASVCGPPAQSTPCLMSGFQPIDGVKMPTENALDITLTNVSAATVEARRAGLDACRVLTVRTSADGPSQLSLTNLAAMAGATVTIDRQVAPSFNGVLGVPAGSHTFVIQRGPGCA